MPTLRKQRITSPKWEGGDGLELKDGKNWVVEDSIIDLSDCDLDEIDECTGITHGCTATFRRCWIRGAGKLILCGCGDEQYIESETGKRVEIYDSLLEDGGRRFPEVQSGMSAHLEGCLIRNWGDPSRFDTRNFGAWAHAGGTIEAVSCVFWQDKFLRPVGQFVKDIANHIGQAVNDSGLKALFRGTTYLPGVCRGLMAGPGGVVKAYDCYRNHSWIRLEGFDYGMPKDKALEQVARLKEMAKRLDAELG